MIVKSKVKNIISILNAFLLIICFSLSVFALSYGSGYSGKHSEWGHGYFDFMGETLDDGYTCITSGEYNDFVYLIYSNSTVRLEQEANSSNSYIMLIGYDGDETSIITPESINGIPVKYIGGGYGWYAKDITISNGVEEILPSAFIYKYKWKKTTSVYGEIETGYNNILEKVTIPGSVKSIQENAFNCGNLKTVILNEGLQTIGEGAFSGTAITSITLPHSLTSIGDKSFAYSSLKEININSDNLYIGNDAFAFSKDLSVINLNPSTKISISEAMDFGNTYDFETAFGGYFKNNDRSIKSLGNVLFQVTEEAGKNIVIPDNIDTIAPCAFKENTVIESISMSDNVTNIGDYSFSSCISLKEINFSKSLKSIGSRAFFYCKSLTSVELPDSLLTIGDAAFADCLTLNEVTIPTGITSIGEYAFAGTDLQECTILSPNVSIGTAAFGYKFVSSNIKEDDTFGPLLMNQTSNYSLNPSFVLHGYNNSTAQEYANMTGIAFSQIGDNSNSTNQNAGNNSPIGSGSNNIGGIVIIVLFVAFIIIFGLITLKRKSKSTPKE